VLREHEEEGVFVMEAAVRSFPPVDPLSLRWSFPMWSPAGGVDSKQLKGLNSKSKEQQVKNDKESMEKVFKALLEGPGTNKKLQDSASMGRDKLSRILSEMVSEDQISLSEEIVGGIKCNVYRIPDSMN
jgi:hypothetical protein